MVLGVAPQRHQGGVEAQIRKLFEACRLRVVPIITLVRKLDRKGRDPFDLLDALTQGSSGIDDETADGTKRRRLPQRRGRDR